MLNSLKELITLLQNEEEIIRFKKLESLIDHNKSIQSDFTLLLDLQKKMVQKEYKGDNTFSDAQTAYEKQLEVVRNYPIIEEYLDLLDYINTELRMIQSIIETEIAKDFD